MQFKPWFQYYEENKDSIDDPDAAYKQWYNNHTKFLEQIAFKESKNIGDDGLFPNYSDLDIWVSGFVAGCMYSLKNK